MKAVLFLFSFCTSAVLFSQGNIDLEKASAIYERGKDLYYEGDYKDAIKTLDSCLNLLSPLNTKPVKLHVRAEQRIGSAYRRDRNYEDAIMHLLKAKSYAEEVYGAESDRVAGIISDLGLANEHLGRYSESLNYFDSAIAMQKALDGHESAKVAGIRMNKGILYFAIGNYSKSASTLLDVLESYQKTLDPDDQNYNRVYLTLSNVYRKMGDVDLALKYAFRALEIKLLNYKETHPSVTKYYMNVGKALVEVGRSKEAEAYFQKARRNANVNNDRQGLGSIINDAGRIYLDNGNFERALKVFRESKSTLNSLNADAYSAEYNIATSLYELGRKEEAYLLLQEISRERPDAQNQLRLSKWARRLGRKQEAISYADVGSKMLEDGDELMRIDYMVNESKLLVEDDLEQAWKMVNEAIDQLTIMRRTYSGETSRDYINRELESIFYYAVMVGIERHKIDPTSESVFQDLYLKVEQAKAASFWDNESEDNASYYGGVPPEVLENLDQLRSAGVEAAVELNRKLEELERDYPKYFQVKYSLDFPSLEQVREGIAEDMVVMDYFVLDGEVLNLVIFKNGFEVLKYQKGEVFSFQEELEILRPEIRRISIIPHDFIHKVAFDGIVHPESNSYLLYHYAFSFQVNTRGLLNEEQGQDRMTYLGIVPSWGEVELSGEINRDELVALPGAFREVETVAKMFKGVTLSADQATESNYGKLASDFDILHFATHAQVDPDNELKSTLFLSTEEQENDGLLEMDEIMKSEIESELVILSACETGAGGFKTGEGVMSLARAFQYAGAKSVLMSLWRTNDQSAHPIIVNFIKNYKAGMTKDVALQQSKISFLEMADPLLRQEFYWAGFLISGNLLAPATSGMWKFIVMGFVIILISFVLYRLM